MQRFLTLDDEAGEVELGRLRPHPSRPVGFWLQRPPRFPCLKLSMWLRSPRNWLPRGTTSGDLLILELTRVKALTREEADASAHAKPREGSEPSKRPEKELIEEESLIREEPIIMEEEPIAVA
ncbi:uncharacterized protein A4U43_C07F27850 [Asparagus officinalis]|uniref:Uncharacterized protein n=1 Tax=Asparagus officinalis TaxID=4686 RepID=A0A5P1EFI0_ASPOF|nr:uncharacterized protein A4U43_C07F27850 [Asparagus officinalis]